MEGGQALGGKHAIQYTDTKLYTQNLYNVINQCYPINFLKIIVSAKRRQRNLSKMKEQEKTPGKEWNKTETSNLPDKENFNR